LKLYIAEKPSLGKAIAAALPKPHKKHQGYIEVANGDCVTWCIGHILEQAEPEKYDSQFKKWQLAHLPITPDNWQLVPKYKTKSQLAVIRKLVKQASSIVHAGDPDREGQLLVDEVLDYIKLSKTLKQNTSRLLISDLNINAVKRALKQQQPNQNFIPLSVSALARARADWLYGINLTRAMTIQGGKVGYQGVLSAGRVQTPVLGLVVKRDKEIEQFTESPFYEVEATVQHQNGEFNAKWQPSEACSPYMDEEGRVVVKALAENVVKRIENQPATVLQSETKKQQQSAPLPFNLSALQIAAAKQFSMNAKLVLDICQSLYEKHQLITYPRSDCQYLPQQHFEQRATIVSHIEQSSLPIAKFVKQADLSIKSRAWNDKKVGAHHAIIPTEKPMTKCSLTSFEKNIYQLIAKQYLAQFFASFEFKTHTLVLDIAGGKFKASEKTTINLGWKCLYQSDKAKDEDQLSVKHLPSVKQSDTLHCLKGILLEKMTQPPKHFTDATLLAAMTGISRFVQDKSLKSILKETDGLGTEATRAGIIDLLFKRGFLVRQGKQIRATEVGHGLISALPTPCALPDMTAYWELTLDNIANKKASYDSFMSPLNEQLTQLIGTVANQVPESLRGLKSPKPSYMKKRHRKKSA